jgi:hypothetical protein
MMSGYTPLFGSIVCSSIWDEDKATRIVWITMLALAEANGIVEGSPKGLAHQARVSVKECLTALEILKSPDPYSRSKNDEGRRIEEVDGGWRIVNHRAYRLKAKSRAEYYRKWRQQQAEEQKGFSPTPPIPKETQTHTQTQTVQQRATRATVAQQLREGEGYTIDQVKAACVLVGIPEEQAQNYYDHYSSQGWKKANGQQITELRTHMVRLWDAGKRCWKIDLGPNGQAPDQGKSAMTTWMERHKNDPD